MIGTAVFNVEPILQTDYQTQLSFNNFHQMCFLLFIVFGCRNETSSSGENTHAVRDRDCQEKIRQTLMDWDPLCYRLVQVIGHLCR